MYNCKICLSDIDLDSCINFNTKGMFFGYDLKRHQCPVCDVIFGDIDIINWTKDEMKNKNIEVSQSYHEGDLSEYEIYTFEFLKPEKGKIYLNFASGEYDITNKKLRSQGYNVYSYEPFIYKGKDPFIITNLRDLLRFRFDGIFSHNALEHFSDPLKEMALIKSILNKKASVVHRTACFEYKYQQSEFHMYFYLGRSSEFLCKNSGFSSFEMINDGCKFNL